MDNSYLKEVIDQAYDMTMTLSEISDSPVPPVEEIMRASDNIYLYFSKGVSLQENDFYLSLAKNHVYERVNREEILSSSISIKMILECADQFRTEITKKKKVWGDGELFSPVV